MLLKINRRRAATNVFMLGLAVLLVLLTSSPNADHSEEIVSTKKDSRMMLRGRKVFLGPPLAGHFAAQAAGVRPCVRSYHL